MKSHSPPPPSRAEVAAQLMGLMSGQVSRDEADRWAGQWVAVDQTTVTDSAVWEALCRLHGVDLRHGPDGPFLHDDRQLAEWLDELLHSAPE